MLRHLASTTADVRQSKAPQCSKLKALVLNLFSHYLLFDLKSEVYDVRDSGALRQRRRDL
jgi:hypothetical protein